MKCFKLLSKNILFSLFLIIIGIEFLSNYIKIKFSLSFSLNKSHKTFNFFHLLHFNVVNVDYFFGFKQKFRPKY